MVLTRSRLASAFNLTGIAALAAFAGIASLFAAAWAADPSVRLEMGAGAPDGVITVTGRPNGGALSSAQLRIAFDPGEVDAPTAANLAVGPGWQVTNLIKLNAGTVRIDMFHPSGQASPGPMLAIDFHHTQPGFRAATIRIDGSSVVDGEDSDGLPGPFFVSQQSVAFVYGRARKVGSSISGLVAAGANGKPVVAVVGDSTLYLLDASDADLSPLPGWESGRELGAGASGRPAFGAIDGQMAVAVGTDFGQGLVFRVSDGQKLFDETLGDSIATAPAINGATNDVYWAVQTQDGPALVHQRIGGSREATPLGTIGEAATSSPAITTGLLIVGAAGGVKVFRVDPQTGALTAQSDGGVTGEAFDTSPVVVGGGMALVGSSAGRVHRLNLATGKTDGDPVSLPDGAAPLSHPFYDAANDMALFGGTDGRLHRVTSGLQFTALPISTAALYAPVFAGGQVFVTDAGFSLTRRGAVHEGMALSTSLGQATAVTGSQAGTDQVIVTTANGYVIAVPLPE